MTSTPSQRHYLSMAVATVMGLLVIAASTTVMFGEALHDLQERNALTVRLVDSTAHEVRRTLQRLVKDFRPDCSPENLKSLREFAFVNPYVGSVGIHDAQGRMLCTSLQTDRVLPTYEPTTVSEVGVDGLRYYSEYGQPVRMSGVETTTVRVRLGNFSIDLLPYAMAALRESGADLVRRVSHDKSDAIAFGSEKLTSDARSVLSEPESFRTGWQFSWRLMALIQSEKVSDTKYVVQSWLPLVDALGNAELLLMMAMMGIPVVFILSYREANRQFERLASLNHRIRSLLVEENLVLHYQPIIDLKTGYVAGCEVLMRLNVGNTMLQPTQVLEAVLANHLTWELDKMVLKNSVRELIKHLPNQSFKVAVNLFPENFNSERVLEVVRGVLPSGFGSKVINLEVIEQHYSEEAVKEVQRLRDHGFVVSVDDFGTGYSNLGNVRAIRPDYLKIDRSFVTNVGEESVRASMVPEIIAIGRAVNAALVAEGIETPQQMNALRSMGVEYGQGYLFAKPMPIDDFVEFVRKHGPGAQLVEPMQTLGAA